MIRRETFFLKKNNRKITKNGQIKKHAGLDTTGGFNHYNIKIGIPDNYGNVKIYNADSITRIDKNGKKYFYDLDKIKDTGQKVVDNKSKPITDSSVSFRNTIQQNTNNVNTISKHSVSTKDSEKSSFSMPKQDSIGRKLSEKQQEYFKDSKVRDESGNLKVMYHGTDADFNTFNYDNYGKIGTAYVKGFYFTDNKETGKSSGKHLKEVYWDIKKPMEIWKTTMSKEEYGRFVKAIDKESNGVVTADYGSIQDAINEYDQIFFIFKEVVLLSSKIT